VKALKNFRFLITAALISGVPLLASNLPVEKSYTPENIQVLGTLDSGQTSPSVVYPRPGRYRAFVFEGNGHDSVEINVTGANGKAYVALADSTLTPIASGIGHLQVSLPYHGPDTEAFYILVKPTTAGPSRFAVHLKTTPVKTNAGPVQPASFVR
jgi:hypothetical protein